MPSSPPPKSIAIDPLCFFHRFYLRRSHQQAAQSRTSRQTGSLRDPGEILVIKCPVAIAGTFLAAELLLQFGGASVAPLDRAGERVVSVLVA